MTKLLIVFFLACVCAVSQSSPVSSDEGRALIQEQAQHDYNHGSVAIQQQAQHNYNQHQQTLQNHGDYSSSSLANLKNDANGFTFDNKDVTHRDRGYGFEKAYAYSRDTAFFDFDDNKGALNARDLVENHGNLEKADDLLKNVPK